MEREELLKSREYWIAEIQNSLYAVIEDYMKKEGLTRKSLADRLKVSKGYVSQVLNGDFNHKISKLVDLSLAAGKAPVIHFEDLENYITVNSSDSKNETKGMEYKIIQNFISIDTKTNQVTKATLKQIREMLKDESNIGFGFSKETVSYPISKGNLTNFPILS